MLPQQLYFCALGDVFVFEFVVADGDQPEIVLPLLRGIYIHLSTTTYMAHCEEQGSRITGMLAEKLEAHYR